MAIVKPGCDCGCNIPVATTPKGMLEFLANRMEMAGVSDGVARLYAEDIRSILANMGEPEYPKFYDWWDEIENYSTRGMRCMESIEQFQTDVGKQTNLLIWLEAAFEAGRLTVKKD